MSTDDKGRTHDKPCGAESCGLFDIARWRSQANKEVESCLPLRDKMSALQRVRLIEMQKKLELGLPDNVPGSITQAVFVWANLAGDAEKLRVEVETKPTTEDDDDDDDDAGDDDSDDDDDDDDDDDGDTGIEISPHLNVDALRGANFGGLMPWIVGGGLAAFAIWSKPARLLKGKRK